MKNNSILLLGSTGTLGSNILKNNYFKNCLIPSSKKLNLKNIKTIFDFFEKNKIDTVIHCAAISSMLICEKNPVEAINTNIIGTQNLVEVIRNQKKKIKLIYISTDGVYPPNKGNNSEEDRLKPYNIYCFTKLCAENIVRTIDKFVIIRTRFFDIKKLKFKSYATDIYTSSIEVTKLVIYIEEIIKKKFYGIINVGEPRDSNYNKIKKFNKNIIPCKYNDLIKNINYVIAKDASMNLSKMNKIFKNDESN